jgi:hypothetical protein|tara:strand:+ start:610 stop:906 length:297 start_codon:yes stop_codon:yes gene_type:complete
MIFKKNFTTGILLGICSVLLLLVITGTKTIEKTNLTTMYEFYDLKDTRGLIFNKFTGEIKYEEIRENPIPDGLLSVRLSNWNGLNPEGGGRSRVKFFD